MIRARRPWQPRPTCAETAATLAHDLRCSPLTARLLAARGVEDPEIAERFLAKRLADLHRPGALTDMDRAADRLARAIDQRERILVHGDFDVDGSTATTLLVGFARACGHDATAWIPHRIDDGYGLSSASFEAVREHRAQLMVTVDCGICDHGLAARIERELGCDVVITDHHLPQDALPSCTAVVNPNRSDCSYPDPGLAGVGVAWKLAWATATRLCGGDKVSERLREFLLDSLALVAIGTVADCAPLDGENRILVHHGLKALARTTAPGLRALLDQARVGSVVGADDIGWRIGPLLNASGRLSSALRNVELLTTADPERAAAVMAEIVEENDERRRISQQLTEDLLAEVETNEDYGRRASLVFAGDGWHPGVVGIVASRLAERFGKPSCVIAIENGLGRGSLRSIPGIHLGEAIAACEGFLRSGGGHAAAAGLTIEPEQVPGFIEAFEAHIGSRHPGLDVLPGIDHDGPATTAELDAAFFDELAALEPFGQCNPEPVLELRDVAFVRPPELFGRNGDHLRGALTGRDGGMLQLLLWKARERHAAFAQPGGRFDMLVTPGLNRWRGNVQPRLTFVDGRTR